MKRLVFLIAGLIIFLSTANAQYDPGARKILDKMSEKYMAIPSFTADIVYTLENVEDDIHESFEGEIGIKQDKFRLIAAEQEIIINNNTVWTYLAEENEVNIDNYDPDDQEVTPSNIYSIYKKGYKYILFGEEKIDGKSYFVVDLSPEDTDSDYFRIRLFIGNTDSVLRKFTMYADSGNRYIYDIKNFNPKANLSDNYFVFNVERYEGIDVIDLRIDN